MTEKLSITTNLVLDFQASISYEKFLSDYDMIIEAFNKETVFSGSNGEPLSSKYLNHIKSFDIVFGVEYELIDKFSYKITYLENLLFKIYERIFYGGLDLHKAIMSGWLLKNSIHEIYSSDHRLAKYEIEDMRKEFEKDGYLSNLNSAYLCYSKVNCLKKNPHKKMKVFQLDTDGSIFAKDLLKQARGILYILRQIKYEAIFEKTHYIEYIAFCSLFLSKELCFVYDHHLTHFAKIIDKKDIGKYIDRGCYTFNLSKVIWEYFASFAGEQFSEKREKHQSRTKLMDDMKEMALKTKDLKIAIDVSDSHPSLMTANRETTSIKQYHSLEQFIGDFGEITKVKNRGRTKTLKARKHFKYDYVIPQLNCQVIELSRNVSRYSFLEAVCQTINV